MEKPMKTQKLLAAILVLQGVILMNQWLGSGVSVARGDIPDSGAQLNQIIDELKSSNSKLDQTMELLESGKVQVQVVKPDENEKQ
jgi:hypothetical protein